MVGRQRVGVQSEMAAKARPRGWVQRPRSNVPNSPHPCSACSCAGRCWPGHAASQVDSGKARPTPTLRFSVPRLSERVQLSESQKQGDLSSRATAGPCGTTPPRWAHFLKRQTSVGLKAAAELRSVASLPRRATQGAARGDCRPRRQRKTVLPSPNGLGFPCRRARQGQGPRRQAQPHATALSTA